MIRGTLDVLLCSLPHVFMAICSDRALFTAKRLSAWTTTTAACRPALVPPPARSSTTRQTRSEVGKLFLHHFIFKYCFVFVSSMSIWHLLTCIGHIYQCLRVCCFSYDLYTSHKTSVYPIGVLSLCVWQESLALWPVRLLLLWTWRWKIKKRMTWMITTPQMTSNQTTRVIKGI